MSVDFFSRTVLSDLSDVFTAPNPSAASLQTRASSINGVTVAHANSTTSGHAPHDASSLQPEVARIWSLLFSNTEPTPIAPLSFEPLASGKLASFTPSQFELTRAADPSSSSIGEGACYLVEKRTLSSVHGSIVVAVKTPKIRGLTPSRHVASLILRELQVLTHAPLQAHHNIASIIGYLPHLDGGSSLGLSLVVDLASHGTLREYLARPLTRDESPHSLTTKLSLLHDVASGLEALHACRVVQGDVKTENVLVFDAKGGRPGEVVAKLSDFGHAILLDHGRPDEPKQYLGTAVLNSPEARERNSLTVADLCGCDVFSYGVVVWETVLDGARYLSACAAPREREGVIDWLKALPQDELLRLALKSIDHAYSCAEPPLFDVLQLLVKASLRDNRSKRRLIGDIVKTFRRLAFLAGISRSRDADKDITPEPLIQGGEHVANELVHQDDLGIMPMPVRLSMVSQLEELSLSPVASTSIQQRACLNIALASFSNFVGKADPATGMGKLQEAAVMGSVTALALHCRLRNVFDAVEAVLQSLDPHSAMYGLAMQLMALPEDSSLSIWLRTLEHYYQRQARETMVQVFNGDHLLADDVPMTDIPSYLESLPTLDVSSLRISAVGQPEHLLGEGNPCFESPLLLAVACRVGHLGIVQPLLGSVFEQHQQQRDLTRELIASSLFEACRGGHIAVVEHIVRNIPDGLGAMMWSGNATGIHWLFMLPPDDQRRALDLMVDDETHYWYTGLRDNVLEPGIRLEMATLSGTPIEFATSVGAISTVEILAEKISSLQTRGRLSEIRENIFRQAVTHHMASAIKVLLPLELHRRRAGGIEAAQARLRLSQGKTEFESFGIFDVGHSVSSLSLGLLHGSSEAVAKAAGDTIDLLISSGVATINDMVSSQELGQTPLADAVRWAPCSFDADILAVFISRGANFGDMPSAVVLSRLIQPRPVGTRGLVMRELLRARLLITDPGLVLQAVQTGDAEIVAAILDYAPSSIPPNYVLKEKDDATEVTLLQASVLVPGGEELVQLLLDRGASIDEARGELTPLELAIAKPSDALIIDILIERGASLRSSKYTTVIHFAASLGVTVNGSHVLSHLLHHARARALLAEMRMNSDDQQISPVHMACFSANVEAIAALLEVGVELPRGNDEWNVLTVSVFIGKRPHMNALHPIMEEDEDKVYAWKMKLEKLILYLLDRLEPGHGRTPLHVACQIGNVRRVRQLIKEDIETLNACDASGNLPVDFIEDADALEEQRLTRGDITRHTVANARRVYECVETALKNEIAAVEKDTELSLGTTLKMLGLGPHDEMDLTGGSMFDLTSEPVDASGLTQQEELMGSFLKLLQEAGAAATESVSDTSVPSEGWVAEEAVMVDQLDQCDTIVLDGNYGPEDLLPKARELLERKTQKLGELNEGTLEVLEFVVDLLGMLSKQDEVSETVNQLLQRRRASLPEDDPRIFYTWRDRIIVLINANRIEDAVRETREAMAEAERCLGSSHTAYLTFVPTLAAFKCIEGKFDECISMHAQLLETLKGPAFKDRRGIGVRSETVVHLCFHGMNKGDLDEIRLYIEGCLDCLASADPKDFLARFDAAVSLGRTAEQVEASLGQDFWARLVEVCEERLRPRSHCELEARRNLAAHLMKREMFEDAGVQYKKLVKDLTVRKGAKHQETLLVVVENAGALHKQGLTPAALQLLRPALQDLEDRHPPVDDEHRLGAKTLLAEMLLQQEDIEEWEPVARDVASGYAQLDRKSDAAVDAKRSIAAVLGRSGRASEATQMAQECLDVTSEVHSENHERTLAVAGEVHLYSSRCGRWGDCVAMSERALAIVKAVHGESSREFADWLHILGTSMGLAGREGGLDKLMQSIDLSVKLNGGVHSRSSLTSLWSAAVHIREKTPAKALEMLTEALEGCGAVIADEPDSLSVRVRTDIGRCYTDMERPEDAVLHLEQAHREARQLWGDSSTETMSIAESLVMALSLLERYKDALPLAHEVLEYSESTAGPSDDETILAASNLANLYFALDKCSAAERLWEKALKGLDAQGDEADQDKVASCRHNRAQALLGILDFDEAGVLVDLAIDHYREKKGPAAKETLVVMLTKADVERLLRNPDAAEAVLLDVLEATEQATDLSKIVGQAEARLGGLWVGTGRYKDAEEILIKALERDRDDVSVRSNLFTAYKKQKKYSEAEEQAAILLSLVPDHVDELAIDAELRLLRLYVEMRDGELAESWAEALFRRLKGLNDYQGNPLDVVGALEELIRYFDGIGDEERLFETRRIFEHVRKHLPLRLQGNLYMLARSGNEEQQ